MPFRPTIHVPLILAGLGLIFFVPGVLLLCSHTDERELARAASMPTANAATLRDHDPGASVLLEGRLAIGNRAFFRDFVACQRDRYAGVEKSGASKDRERWTLVETIAPRLVVDTGGGSLTLGNSGYELLGPPHRWQDNLLLVAVSQPAPERAIGFKVGDEVTLEGRVGLLPGGDPARTFEAQFLFGGDRAAYLDYRRQGMLGARILGGVFLGVGVLLGLVGGLLRWNSTKRKR